MLYQGFKRCLDCIAALLLLIILSPLLLVLSFLVRISIGKPVFFCQVRTGKDAKVFELIKFRSMTDEKDAEGNLLADSERVTRIGRFLRDTSFDELPELLNIVRGDMAIIGPRPLLPRYNSYYTSYEWNRFKVRGGLIPPESLYHDSFITWDQQLQYEADYAENLSLSLDCRILASVFKTIILRNKRYYGVYVRKALDEERSEIKNKIHE